MPKRKNTKRKTERASVERVANLPEEKFVHSARGVVAPSALTPLQERAKAMFERGVPLPKVVENLGIKPWDLMMAVDLPPAANRKLYDDLTAHARLFQKMGNPLQLGADGKAYRGR